MCDYFDGVKKGISFGSDWSKLEEAVRQCQEQLKEFEQDLLDPSAQRLLPQIQQLYRQMKIEFEELDYLMDDKEGCNRETEFEAILYKFTVFRNTLLTIKSLHEERRHQEKKVKEN